MGPEQLRRAIQARPFVNFVIRTVGGVQYQIDHPEFVALSATGRSIAVYSVNDRVFDIVDTIMIESLEFGADDRGSAERKTA